MSLNSLAIYSLFSKLTKDQNCVASFAPICCTFQNTSSRMTIRSARACSGMYYLDPFLISFAQVNKIIVSSCLAASRNDIMWWHYRLGHPSFSYLNYSFPTLFKNKNLSMLKCEICPFAKHVLFFVLFRTKHLNLLHLFIVIWEP